MPRRLDPAKWDTVISTFTGERCSSRPSHSTRRAVSSECLPGYEERRAPDFERVVTESCLFCHTARSRPLDSLVPISCERCHGGVEVHLARPSAKNIVNPARLSTLARDSVCEQCHLGGESRILNPGRKFEDFRPGDAIETVFTTYVNADDASGGARVASHSEEIASSRCAQAGQGRMWCGSCHDPHESPAAPAVSYRQRCLACHSGAGHRPGHRPALVGGTACAECHMPKRPSSEAAHTTFTDHRILRRPNKSEPAAPVKRLRVWRPPPIVLAERNLGLGYIGAGERLQSTALSKEGLRILSGAGRTQTSDPAALTALGTLLLQNGDSRQAVAYLRQAAARENSARSQMNLAVALHAHGDPHQAMELLEKALTMDPLLEEAYIWLMEFYRKAGRQKDASETMRKWMSAYPQSFGPRLAVAR